MLIIRLQKKKRTKVNTPSYQIVLINHKRSPQSQKVIKKLGSFSYTTKIILLNIKAFIYWIQKGAKLSNKLFKLLNVSSKLISRPTVRSVTAYAR